MKLTTRKKNVKATKQSDLSSQEIFNKAWKRVSNQQNKNDRLREQIKTFAEQVTEAVEDQEKAYITTLYQSCEHLLIFYSRKSLAAWHREVLMEWILEYVDSITHNPFASDIDLSPLYQTMEAIVEKIHPDELDLFQDDAMHSDQHFFDEMDEEDDSASMFEDLFSDFEHDSDEFFRQQESFEQQRKEDEQALNKLMKSGSINKLFRRVARVLHPDREQNEDARLEKNRLMSELIEARDNNDIATLFAFYAEYIGQSPLEELGGDLADATQLLNRQYAQLRSQHADIPYEDPKTGILYQRFHKKTMKASQHGINAHLANLEQDMNNLKLFCKEVTSLNKLKPYLQVRWEHFNEECW
jgi:curved DNA-binding protein CbpA